MSYMLEALSGSVQASALDLSQNGIATLEFQDQHRRLHHVSTLLVGRLGDLWEWIVLNHQHSPSVPQIAMLIDMRVAALSSKRYSNLIPITIIRSHSTIAHQRYSSLRSHRFNLVIMTLIVDKGDNRSLGAINWTSCIHNSTRTMVPNVPWPRTFSQACSPHLDVGPSCASRVQ